MIAIPFWLKIVGPLVLLAVLFGAWRLDRHSYGEKRFDAGVEQTDAKWVTASEKLKADAAKSATRADDAAASRLAAEVENMTASAAAVEKAKAEGTSPLDALFGGSE